MLATKVRIKALIAGLCAAMLLSSCSSEPKRYKRISFESEALEEKTECINENTSVLNTAREEFVEQMPIYEISERVISDNERQQLMAVLGLPTNPYMFEHEGNRILINLARYTDHSRGYFELTEEELEELAWKTFNKIPFMEGEYEYVGFRGEQSVSDAKGNKYIERVLVSFYRVIDGARVTGDSQCNLWFDGSGLVELSIDLYDYKKIGTMDMVPLSEAATKIKTPDKFYCEKATGSIDTLRVDRVKLFLVNQYSRGCAILQPMYTFYGTANIEGGKQADFRSSVIAIPESMTYEE